MDRRLTIELNYWTGKGDGRIGRTIVAHPSVFFVRNVGRIVHFMIFPSYSPRIVTIELHLSEKYPFEVPRVYINHNRHYKDILCGLQTRMPPSAVIHPEERCLCCSYSILSKGLTGPNLWGPTLNTIYIMNEIVETMLMLYEYRLSRLLSSLYRQKLKGSVYVPIDTFLISNTRVLKHFQMKFYV